MRIGSWVASITRFLEDKGIGYECVSRAHTGSCYIYLPAGRKIRVSDHADAHGNADYTCDGQEGTLKGCKAWILTNYAIDEAHVAEMKAARAKEKAHKKATKAYLEAIRSGMRHEDALVAAYGKK